LRNCRGAKECCEWVKNANYCRRDLENGQIILERISNMGKTGIGL